MADLDDRFGSLSRVQVPDLWADIEVREMRRPIEGPPLVRRASVAAVALLVAAFGLGAVVIAFRKDPSPVKPATRVSNGLVAFSGGGGIFVVSPDGSGLRRLAGIRGEDALDVHWSPNGSKLAFRGWTRGDYALYIVNADGSGLTNVTGSMSVSEFSWSPDGSMLAFTAFQKENDLDIFVVNSDGTGLRPLVESPLTEHRPQWSPDGTRIAFERWPVRDVDPGTADIYTVGLEGEGAVPLITSSGWDGGVSWSPDGSLIAFSSQREGNEEIHVVNVDGSDERTLTDLGTAEQAAWSPDGARVSFVANDGQQWDVWIVNADGSGLARLTPVERDDGPAVWAPDGSRLAFTASNVTGGGDNTGTFDVYTIRPDGTEESRLTFGGMAMGWDLSWQLVMAPLGTVGSLPSPELPPAPTSAELVETFKVGVDVRSVVYGEGSIWVAVSNADGTDQGRIVRIDPESHEVQADIPVEVIPTWEVGGVDAAVIRIDAWTNEVVDTFELGGEFGADLTLLDGQLWVLVFGDETVDHSMEVVRVDPDTGEVLARIPLTTSWAHTIVAADGRLVVYEGGDKAVNVCGHLTSIDPGTNGLIPAEIPFRYSEGGPVLWRGQVWAAGEDGFARFDPVTGEVLEGWPELDPSRFAFCCLEQNFRPARFSVPQDEQISRPHLLGNAA